MNPAVLTRFALLLQEENSLGKSARRNMVVVAPNAGPRDDNGHSFVRVVGVSGRPALGDTSFNTFSSSFSLAAERFHSTRATFEPNIVEIRNDEVMAFLSELNDVEWEATQRQEGML